MPTKRIRSMEKAIELLSCFTIVESEWDLGRLAQRVELPRSTVHRILLTLCDTGMLAYNEATACYTLGSLALRLGATYLGHLSLIELARPYLTQLRDESGETACLTLRSGSQRMYVEQVESRLEIRMTVAVGIPLSMTRGAAGKVILAELGSHPAGQEIPLALKAELDVIRERGWSVSSGERVSGSTAVAAMIRARPGDPVGAISLSGPSHRFTLEDALRWGATLRKAADQIEEKYQTRMLAGGHAR